MTLRERDAKCQDLTCRSAGSGSDGWVLLHLSHPQPACEAARTGMPSVASQSEPGRAPAGAEIVLVSPQSNRRLVIRARRRRPGEGINGDLADAAPAELHIAGAE